MTDRELAQLLGAQAPPPPEDPAHRARLEAELLAAFERRAGAAARRPSRAWMRYATAAACALCLVTATQVPAGYKVEVGRRVSVMLPAGTPLPEQLAEQVAAALRTRDSKVVDVSVRRRVLRTEAGPQALQVDVWGHGLAPDAQVLARLHALPELRGVEVRLARLEGRVQDTLLGALRHRVLREATTPEAREAARQRLVEELRRVEGPETEVDVVVDELTGKQRIRVKVKRPPPD